MRAKKQNLGPKYVFTGETQRESVRGSEEVTVRRIRAARSFGSVKEGDLGGFIEMEWNLPHEGLCWVADRAVVYGHSAVRNDAQMYHRSTLSGGFLHERARMSGHARAFGGAYMYGDAWLSGSAHLGGGQMCGKTSLSRVATLMRRSDSKCFSVVTEREYGTPVVQCEDIGMSFRRARQYYQEQVGQRKYAEETLVILDALEKIHALRGPDSLTESEYWFDINGAKRVIA